LNRRAALAEIYSIGVIPKAGRAHVDRIASVLDHTSARTPNLQAVIGNSVSAPATRASSSSPSCVFANAGAVFALSFGEIRQPILAAASV
jgi:hypothetical protein